MTRIRLMHVRYGFLCSNARLIDDVEGEFEIKIGM